MHNIDVKQFFIFVILIMTLYPRIKMVMTNGSEK